MCGIAGIVTPDPVEAEAALARMVPAMMHRGPDDGGREILPLRDNGTPASAGLGFRRLAILDVSPTGHQPMRDADSGNVLVFNGEIYNFRELRKELEAAGVGFRGTSDSEVLLHALGRWGEAALDRLEGMYAFAFYRAHDQSLLLARDPLGIKPLYVSRRHGRVVFASEICTVLASGVVPRDVDTAGVTGMLAFGAVQSPRTVFAAIEEFPAGHSQWIGSPARRFWDFPHIHETVAGDAVEATRRLVQDAVGRHLVADVPIGVLLSAGIDSTIVTACAADAGASITAFTVGIGTGHPDDETAIAAATARRLGVRHEILEIDGRLLPSLWHDWIDALDSPSIDGFNTFLVTKGLADRGIKVGLSGLGADELFGGYPVFRSAPRLQRLMAAVALIPTSAQAAAAEACLVAIGRDALAEKVADILRGPRDVGSIAMGLRRVLSDRRLRSMGLLAADRRVPRAAAAAFPGVAPDDDFNVISRVELSHYMRSTLLRDSDANSMRHSLELRVPFLDQSLLTHVLSLPGSAKTSPSGRGKRLLRMAFTSRLPTEVVERQKTGFTLPIDDWMRGPMRDFCDHAIDGLAAVPGLEADAVRNMWRRYLRHPAAMPWSRPLAVVTLGAHLHKHLPRRPGGPV